MSKKADEQDSPSKEDAAAKSDRMSLSLSLREKGVSAMAIIFCLLYTAPWMLGGIAGWLSGDPTRRHVVIIFVTSILLPLAWLGAVNVWQMLFWEKVPATSSSGTGLQHIGVAGPLWEYKRKKR